MAANHLLACALREKSHLHHAQKNGTRHSWQFDVVGVPTSWSLRLSMRLFTTPKRICGRYPPPCTVAVVHYPTTSKRICGTYPPPFYSGYIAVIQTPGSGSGVVSTIFRAQVLVEALRSLCIGYTWEKSSCRMMALFYCLVIPFARSCAIYFHPSRPKCCWGQAKVSSEKVGNQMQTHRTLMCQGSRIETQQHTHTHTLPPMNTWNLTENSSFSKHNGFNPEPIPRTSGSMLLGGRAPSWRFVFSPPVFWGNPGGHGAQTPPRASEPRDTGSRPATGATDASDASIASMPVARRMDQKKRGVGV